MCTIVSFLVGTVIGLILGFAIFRNNQEKFNKIEADAEAKVEEVKVAVEAVKKPRRKK